MKNIKKKIAVALISISTMVFIACNSNSNKSNNTNTDNFESNSPSQQQQEQKEESKTNNMNTGNYESNSPSQQEEPQQESSNGLYSYEDNSAKLSIRVSDESWSGKTLIVSGFGEEYDNQNAQYENGIVKGKELFDNSGMVKIGYISGNSLTTSISGQSLTLRK